MDIGLDPMPGGGTTHRVHLDGRPVVTCAGDTLMGRLSASLMHRLGLPDYVCDTPDKYVETVLDRSNDVEHLSAVRGALRGMAKETIFNGRQYVAELEEAVHPCGGQLRKPKRYISLDGSHPINAAALGFAVYRRRQSGGVTDQWHIWIDRGTFTDVVARKPDGTLLAGEAPVREPGTVPGCRPCRRAAC